MTTSAVGRRSFDTWYDLKRDLIPHLFDGGPFQSGRYLFRGCGDAGWSLTSSFDRRFHFLPGDQRVVLWTALLGAFRETCAEHGVAPEILGDDRALLAFGQHHGLPTRLLDWSLSPYVASFFAFRQALDTPGATGQVALWVLDTRSSAWSAEMGVELIAPLTGGNSRLRNQSGRFTYARTPHLTLEDYVTHLGFADGALTQFSLPRAEAVRALPDLDAMGANAANLFPDWSGLAEGVTLRMQLQASTASAPSTR
ncbi:MULTISPECIES: FRG domain-containing protein [unclassified Geodermatophilus]|uniref:FRG domain-containing protein n=1 Tax=unclassified Geodermatophilus TaxID=2637632 RepID=UPI003EE9BBEA